MAIAQKIGGVPGVTRRTALMAYLDDLFAAYTKPGGPHPLGVVNGEGHRFFLIDVLAGVERVDEVLGMEVLRSGDEHRIDTVVFKQQAVVVEDFAAGNALQGALAMGAVDVADRGNFNVGTSYGLRREVGSSGAVTNDAKPHPVIGSGHGAWYGESAQTGGDLTQELSSGTHVLIITAVRLTASMITADAGSERANSYFSQSFPVSKTTSLAFV
jgi:hypothetical protein